MPSSWWQLVVLRSNNWVLGGAAIAAVIVIIVAVVTPYSRQTPETWVCMVGGLARLPSFFRLTPLKLEMC